MLLHENYINFFVNLQAVVVTHYLLKYTNILFYIKCIYNMADGDKTLIGDRNLSNNNQTRKTSAPNFAPSESTHSDTHPTQHVVMSENSALKRKQTSFQITSVTVKGSRLSTDGGDDSADDLDESHADDANSEVLDCSRTTDVDSDQKVQETSNLKNESFDQTTSTPIKSKTELPVIKDAQNEDPFSPESPKDKQQTAPAENPNVNPTALPDQWQHRFRVVKIVSSEPFKRGRWLCMDFMDPPVPAVETKPEVLESTTNSGSHLISSTPESIPADKVAHIYEISPSDAYPGSISVAVGPDQIQQPMYGIFLPVNNGHYPFISGINTIALQKQIQRHDSSPPVTMRPVQQILNVSQASTLAQSQVQHTHAATMTASLNPTQQQSGTILNTSQHHSQNNMAVSAPNPVQQGMMVNVSQHQPQFTTITSQTPVFTMTNVPHYQSQATIATPQTMINQPATMVNVSQYQSERNVPMTQNLVQHHAVNVSQQQSQTTMNMPHSINQQPTAVVNAPQQQSQTSVKVLTPPSSHQTTEVMSVLNTAASTAVVASQPATIIPPTMLVMSQVNDPQNTLQQPPPRNQPSILTVGHNQQSSLIQNQQISSSLQKQPTHTIPQAQNQSPPNTMLQNQQPQPTVVQSHSSPPTTILQNQPTANIPLSQQPSCITQSHQLSSMTQNQLTNVVQSQQTPSLGMGQQVTTMGQNQQVLSMGQNQQVSSMGQNQQVPSMGQNQQVSSMSQNPQVTAMNQIQQVPSMGQIQQVPSIVQIQQVSSMGQIQHVPPMVQNQVSSMGQNQQIPPMGQNQQIPTMSHSQHIPSMVQNQQTPSQVQNQQLQNVSQNQILQNFSQNQQPPSMAQNPQLPSMTHNQQLPSMVQNQQLPNMVQNQQLQNLAHHQQLQNIDQKHQTNMSQNQQLPSMVQTQHLPNMAQNQQLPNMVQNQPPSSISLSQQSVVQQSQQSPIMSQNQPIGAVQQIQQPIVHQSQQSTIMQHQHLSNVQQVQQPIVHHSQQPSIMQNQHLPNVQHVQQQHSQQPTTMQLNQQQPPPTLQQLSNVPQSQQPPTMHQSQQLPTLQQSYHPSAVQQSQNQPVYQQSQLHNQQSLTMQQVYQNIAPQSQEFQQNNMNPNITQSQQPLLLSHQVQVQTSNSSHSTPVVPPTSFISSTTQVSDMSQTVVPNVLTPPNSTPASVSQTSSIGTQAPAVISNIPEVYTVQSIKQTDPSIVSSHMGVNYGEHKELGTPPSSTPQSIQETPSENLPVKNDVNGEDSESVPSGTNTVAIDNKIEQAMDLVKSHLMFAVREEVDVLKEKITELMDRISQLEYENGFLKANASQQTLEQLNQTQLLQQQQQQQQQNQPPISIVNSIPVTSQSTQQINIQNSQPTS